MKPNKPLAELFGQSILMLNINYVISFYLKYYIVSTAPFIAVKFLVIGGMVEAAQWMVFFGCIILAVVTIYGMRISQQKYLVLLIGLSLIVSEWAAVENMRTLDRTLTVFSVVLLVVKQFLGRYHFAMRYAKWLVIKQVSK